MTMRDRILLGLLAAVALALVWAVAEAALTMRDWRQLVRDIAAAGYATEPNYDNEVLAMLDQRAAQALAAARAQRETREV